MPRNAMYATCICAVLAIGGTVMAQGFGSNKSGPDISTDATSNSLRMTVTDGRGAPITGTTLTVLTNDGEYTTPTIVGDGQYSVTRGIGSKTVINVSHPTEGSGTIEMEITGNTVIEIVIANGVVKWYTGGAVETSSGDCSNCCTGHAGGGCDDPKCEAIVCANDDFCCIVIWDALCASFAAANCGDLCACAAPCPGECDPATGVCCVTQSTDKVVIGVGQIACGNAFGTTPNGWARCFDFADHGIPAGAGGHTINCVTFGIQQATVDDIAIDVVIYTVEACPPIEPGVDAIEVARVSTTVSTVQEGSFVTVQFPGGVFIPDGVRAVVQVGSEVDGSIDDLTGFSFRPAANAGGQCGPSYIITQDGSCGLGGWVDLADIGFPDAHLILSVGLDGEGECDCAPPAAPVLNDDCADRIEVFNGTTTFTSVGATTDGPSPCSILEADVWFNYNATFSGDLIVDTNGSTYDTVLAIYDGCSCPVGDPIDCNDDINFPANPQSSLTIPVVSGTCYKIQVGGFAGDQGLGNLNIEKILIQGACCFTDGSCEVLTAVDCENAGGSYAGDDTACQGPPEAAACGSVFEDISGSGDLAPISSSSDDSGEVVPIGFTFTFFGDSHDTIGVTSNGYLTFGPDLGDFSNDPIPSTIDPNDAIFPAWEDYSPNDAGTVHTQTLGTEPNRRFIAQWTDVPPFGAGGANPSTFQAVLFEGSNCIEFRYVELFLAASVVIGVENQDGTAGLDASGIEGDCIVICPTAGPCLTDIPINVDIKPGQCPNPFHLTGNEAATLEVAIVGKGDFDVTTIDASSITISRVDGVGGSAAPVSSAVGDVATPSGLDPCGCHDLNGDGIPDLVLQFQRTELQSVLELNAGMVDLGLRIDGLDVAGTVLVGSDCVNVN